MAVGVNVALNCLDAVAYGQLLFPQARAYGIIIYLLSTIASQFIMSITSSFHQPIAACMIVEAIPFMLVVSRSMPNISSVVFGYAIMTLVSALGYLTLLVFKLERTIHQVPRIVLLGTMAGVGIYLTTASAWITDRHPAIFWIGLSFGLMSVVMERSSINVPQFFIPICAVIVCIGFYLAVLVYYLVWDSNLDSWRTSGWLNRKTRVNVIDFFSQLEFYDVNIGATLKKTVPTAISCAIFNMLHVPLNVPALARYSGSGFSMNRELLAHACANFLSAFIGPAPTYLAYTNSILFLKSGGRRVARFRLCGVMLGIMTATLLLAFDWILPFVPNVLAVFLACNLGIDLVVEAAVMPFKTARLREYISILMITFVCVYSGFIQGLFVGLLYAGLVAFHDLSTKGKEHGHHDTINVVKSVDAVLLDKLLHDHLNVSELSGCLYFNNSVSTIDALSTQPSDTIFQIIDFTNVTACDLNVVEGILHILAHPPDFVEIVLVNGEGRGLEYGCRINKTPNYPSLEHAKQHCRDRLLDHYLCNSDSLREEYEGDKSKYTRICNKILSADGEYVDCKEGDTFDLAKGYVIHITRGACQIASMESTYADTGSWLFTPCTVKFTEDSTIYYYYNDDDDKRNLEEGAQEEDTQKAIEELKQLYCGTNL